jgi:hypothetical protein
VGVLFIPALGFNRVPSHSPSPNPNNLSTEYIRLDTLLKGIVVEKSPGSIRGHNEYNNKNEKKKWENQFLNTPVDKYIS